VQLNDINERSQQFQLQVQLSNTFQDKLSINHVFSPVFFIAAISRLQPLQLQFTFGSVIYHDQANNFRDQLSPHTRPLPVTHFWNISYYYTKTVKHSRKFATTANFKKWKLHMGVILKRHYIVCYKSSKT